MATIKISPLLNRHTEFKATLIINQPTVLATLEQLTTTYPKLKQYIFDADHDVWPFINIYVNDQDIRSLNNIDTKLEAEDELTIIPAVAGG